VPDDRTMPPNLLHQLTLAILDHSAGDGLRTIKAIRAYLDTWEAFLQDRQELRNHLLVAHKLNPSCMEADPATLNRRHWEAHDSDLATFLGAHPVQA
jgi:hypothetical protein